MPAARATPRGCRRCSPRTTSRPTRDEGDRLVPERLAGALHLALAVRDDRAFWSPLEDAPAGPAGGRLEPAERVLTAIELSRPARILFSRPARILAVADNFEAMTADRPYRAAMPIEQALSILGDMRGTGLCPAAVDAIGVAATGGVTWTADLVASEPDARVSPPVRRPA